MHVLFSLLQGRPEGRGVRLWSSRGGKCSQQPELRSPALVYMVVLSFIFLSFYVFPFILICFGRLFISEVLQDYGSKIAELSKKIIKIALMSLGEGFEKKYYESEFQNCHGYLRMNNYSSPPESLEDHDEVEGLGMHTDMSCVTIVYQDEIGGLQVRSKEGKWMDLSPCEGTLVVNIGDMFQAWSNEKLRSSEHRVILKQPVNRFSLAFFWCFEDEKVIVAPDDVVGEGNVRIYEPFVCSDYLKFRESNERGKFEKVGFTVRGFARIKDQQVIKCDSGREIGSVSCN